MKIKNNLDQLVYDKIIDDMIMGQYKMGDRIMVNSLADEYEISKTPVIQAVKLLCNDDVFQVQKNGWIIVPELTKKDINNVCEVRLLLEQYAIKNVLEKEPEKNKELWNLLEEDADKCKSYFEKNDYLKLAKTDLKFHRDLITGTENTYLREIYRKVQGKFILASYLVLPLKNRLLSKTVDDHYRILKKLKKNDLEGSLQEIEEHITSIYNYITNQESTENNK